MAETEPEWVKAERRTQPGQIRHVEGEKMERCPTCFNFTPYCTCPPGLAEVLAEAEDVIES